MQPARPVSRTMANLPPNEHRYTKWGTDSQPKQIRIPRPRLPLQAPGRILEIDARSQAPQTTAALTPPTDLKPLSDDVNSFKPVQARLATELSSQYTCLVQVEQAGQCFVVQNSDRPDQGVLAMRVYNRKTTKSLTKQFLQHHHMNLVYIYDILEFENKFCVMEEFMDLTLADAIGSPIRISEEQASYISSEVLKGVRFIANLHYEHPNLDASRVLISQDGSVKIAESSLCIKNTKRSIDNANAWFTTNVTEAVRVMTYSMLTKAIIEPGDDLSLPSSNFSQETRNFVESAARSLDELINHRFIEKGRATPASCIQGIVVACLISVKRTWACPRDFLSEVA
ncbi:hypothetical protein TWF281_002150 [Arthrobotrys megalospora]